MILSSSKGQVQIADAPFAKGGEGSVYEVIDNGNFVVKLYHEKERTQEKEDKILAMLSTPPSGAMKTQIVWPIDALHDENGRFVGFLMHRVFNAVKIDALYSYDYRNEHDYKFYIQVAQNLCAVVDAVHASGHLCGDLNPSNIYVNPQTAYVTLVDTDSYHICSASGEVFPCFVCRGEYVPIELHRLMNDGGNLHTTTKPTFAKQTDYFALAVHIFALLMNGCHPYACTVVSTASISEFSIIKNIAKGKFPFAKEKSQVAPPAYAPPISALPDTIQELMMLAFWAAAYPSPMERPSTEMWHSELKELSESLVQCGMNKSHQYWSKATTCPLCEAEDAIIYALKIASKIRNQPEPTAPKDTPSTFSQSSAHIGMAVPYALDFSDATFLSVVILLFGMSSATAIWGGVQLLYLWLFSFIPIPSGWEAIGYLLAGICSYIPLWFYVPIHKTDFKYSIIGAGMTLVFNYSIVLAILFFGIGRTIISWDSSFYTVLNPILACSVPVGLYLFLPRFTRGVIKREI